MALGDIPNAIGKGPQRHWGSLPTPLGKQYSEQVISGL